MKVNLSEIETSSISQLSDLEMNLAFQIEAVERQLSRPVRDDEVWREKAAKAKDHMCRAQKLVSMKIDKLYFDASYSIHGAIIAELRREVDVKTFMDCVRRAKGNM